MTAPSTPAAAVGAPLEVSPAVPGPRRYASATAIFDELHAAHAPALRAASDAATLARVATLRAFADLTHLLEDPT